METRVFSLEKVSRSIASSYEVKHQRPKVLTLTVSCDRDHTVSGIRARIIRSYVIELLE